METFFTHKRTSAVSWRSIIALALAVFFFASAAFVGVSPSASEKIGVTRAWGFCGDIIGRQMQANGSWESPFSAASSTSMGTTRLTFEQAFGNNVKYVAYTGEGEGGFLVAEKEFKYPDFVTVEKEKLEAERTFNNCMLNGLNAGNALYKMAGAFVSLMQLTVRTVFNPNLVCDPNDKNPGNTCINLVAVIGGKNNTDGSIIKSLSNSLYFPLLAFVALFVAFYVAYNGVVKRQFRKAFGGVLWCFGAVLIGAALIVHPNMLAKAPPSAASAASTCILGAFSGMNCMSDSGPDDSKALNVETGSTSENICKAATSSTEMSAKMEAVVDSISCKIWKSFILDPYSVASFGFPFDEMDTKAGAASEMVGNADGVSAEDFCVNLSTTNSLSSMRNGTLILNSSAEDGRVCNVVAYQLYLMTNAYSQGDTMPAEGSGGGANDAAKKVDDALKKAGIEPPPGLSATEITEFAKSNGIDVDAILGKVAPSGGSGDIPPADRKKDFRWYRIVELTGNNSSVWNTWNASSSGTARIVAALISMIISILGTIVILITSFFAIIYYISGTILMAFAPIFMLIGIHPGRGKKIMFGWLEKIVANILKYIISAAYVIVTVSLYGGVLASSSGGMGATIMFVVVITAALLMYRKEFVEMLGRADMGGEKISSAAADKLGSMGKGGHKKFRNLAEAGVGGAVGSKLAGGKVTHGFKGGVKRNLKRGTGVVANAARQFDTTGRSNVQKLQAQNKQYEEEQKQQRMDELNQRLANAGYTSDYDRAGGRKRKPGAGARAKAAAGAGAAAGAAGAAAGAAGAGAAAAAVTAVNQFGASNATFVTTINNAISSLGGGTGPGGYALDNSEEFVSDAAKHFKAATGKSISMDRMGEAVHEYNEMAELDNREMELLSQYNQMRAEEAETGETPEGLESVKAEIAEIHEERSMLKEMGTSSPEELKAVEDAYAANGGGNTAVRSAFEDRLDGIKETTAGMEKTEQDVAAVNEYENRLSAIDQAREKYEETGDTRDFENLQKANENYTDFVNSETASGNMFVQEAMAENDLKHIDEGGSAVDAVFRNLGDQELSNEVGGAVQGSNDWTPKAEASVDAAAGSAGAASAAGAAAGAAVVPGGQQKKGEKRRTPNPTMDSIVPDEDTSATVGDADYDDVAPEIDDDYDTYVDEADEIEYKRNKELLNNLGPDEVITGRSLRKMAKRAGKDLQERGYMEEGRRENRRYRRERKRGVVRGKRIGHTRRNDDDD